MKKSHAEIITAAAIAVILVVACLLADRFMPEAPVEPTEPTVAEMRLRSHEAIDLHLKENETPSPSPNPLPADAADIYVDDATVLFTLANADEARYVLTEYLKTGEASVPKEEHLVSVAFEKKIRIIPATGLRPLSSAEEVFDALTGDPSLLPIRVITEAYGYKTEPAGSGTDKTDALQKGLRYYKQLPVDGLTLTVTEKTYSEGVLEDSFVTDTEILAEKRDGSVITGTFKAESEEGEPNKKQGPHGRDAGELRLTLPIRVAVSSYFGFRDGVMHRGIDFPAKAGATIKTPAEGVVVYAGERGDYGKVVEIDHGNGFVSRLTHCDTISVVLNQRVFEGEVVATLADIEEEAGYTAEATGTENGEDENETAAPSPHLHYELLIDGIPYNPMYYIG